MNKLTNSGSDNINIADKNSGKSASENFKGNFAVFFGCLYGENYTYYDKYKSMLSILIKNLKRWHKKHRLIKKKINDLENIVKESEAKGKIKGHYQKNLKKLNDLNSEEQKIIAQIDKNEFNSFLFYMKASNNYLEKCFDKLNLEESMLIVKKIGCAKKLLYSYEDVKNEDANDNENQKILDDLIINFLSLNCQTDEKYYKHFLYLQSDKLEENTEEDKIKAIKPDLQAVISYFSRKNAPTQEQQQLVNLAFDELRVELGIGKPNSEKINEIKSNGGGDEKKTYTTNETTGEIDNSLNSKYKRHIDFLESTNVRGVGNIIGENIGDISGKEYVNKLFQAGLLDINYNLDWKVSRGMAQISKDIGVKDIPSLILEIKDFLSNNIQFDGILKVRDLGPGDLTLMNELDDLLKDKHVLVSGVGDKIYIELYKRLNSTGVTKDVPDDVVKLFVKEFAEKRKSVEHYRIGDLKAMINMILSNIRLENQILSDNSIYGEKTQMFAFGEQIKLSEETINFLKSKSWKEKLGQFKSNLIAKFNNFIGQNYKRVYLSDFRNFYENFNKHTQNSDLVHCHIQFAIKSTSHLDNDSYRQFILDYIKYSNTGDVLIDTGVERSYTMETRIKQLYEISQNTKNMRFLVVFNPNKQNKMYSIIICKKPFENLDVWRKRIDTGLKIQDISYIRNNMHMKIDYYVRNLMSDLIILLFGKDLSKFEQFEDRMPKFIDLISQIKLSNNTDLIKYGFLYIIEEIFMVFLKEIDGQIKTKHLRILSKYFKFKIEIKKYYESIEKNNVKNLDQSNDCGKSISLEVFWKIIEIQNKSFQLMFEKTGNISVTQQKKINTIRDIKEKLSIIMDHDTLLNKGSKGKNKVKSAINELIIILNQKEKNRQGRIPQMFEKNSIFWKSLRVLIVDNNYSLREGFRGWFLQNGCDENNIVLISNGTEAVEIANGGDFDLLITDIDLPGENGLIATHKIKMNNKKIKVFAVVSEEDKPRDTGDLFDKVIIKPFSSYDRFLDHIMSIHSFAEQVSQSSKKREQLIENVVEK